MIIGLTGGSGSGKTTASKVFAEFGGLVIDADVIAREVVEKGSNALKEIMVSFGKDVINADGTLNRKLLGDIVFSDKLKLVILNKITHKYITEKIMNIILTEEEKYPFVIIDAAVLFESGLDKKCDVLIAVTASDDLRIKRISERDGISIEDAKKRINSQMPQNEVEMLCNYVIDTSDGVEQLRKKVEDIVIAINKGGNDVNSSE